MLTQAPVLFAGVIIVSAGIVISAISAFQGERWALLFVAIGCVTIMSLAQTYKRRHR